MCFNSTSLRRSNIYEAYYNDCHVTLLFASVGSGF
jgi:hypothetical protein